MVFLFFIAEWLESHASDRAQRSIVSLMTLAPDVARVTAHGEPRTVPVQDIKIGAVIIVKPEAVPGLLEEAADKGVGGAVIITSKSLKSL